MNPVAERLDAVRATLPAGVTLLAVSKYHPVEAVAEAYDAGQRDFGESRAQELQAKAAVLPSGIRWHFIGHLQTNKVRPVVAIAHLIQSVDSERLLLAIEKEAARIGKTQHVLLEVHVACEETKTGFAPEELSAEFFDRILPRIPSVRIDGIMGMASLTNDADRIAADFRAIAGVYNRLRRDIFAGNDCFVTLSMGMSHDYPIAVAEGSNMVRVGSAIFG